MKKNEIKKKKPVIRGKRKFSRKEMLGQIEDELCVTLTFLSDAILLLKKYKDRMCLKD